MTTPAASRNQSVLLIANECGASGTSEAVQNFHCVNAIARHKPVILLLPKVPGRESLMGCVPGIEIIYLGDAQQSSVDTQCFAKSARLWIREQMRLGREFCIAHQLTKDIGRYPSPLTDLGIPYVLGPVGSFRGQQSQTEPHLHQPYIENDVERFKRTALIQRSLQQAGAILTLDKQTNKRCGLASVEVLPRTHVAMPRDIYPTLVGRTMNVLHVGSAADPKNSRALLKAFVALKDLDGISLYLLQEVETDDCNNHDREFSQTLRKRLAKTDLLVLSDDQVSRGVIEESLAFGVPVMTVSRTDGAQLIDHSCGFVLANTSVQSVALNIAETIRQIRERPFLLTPMRGGARERARELYFWRESSKKLVELYDQLVVEMPLAVLAQ